MFSAFTQKWKNVLHTNWEREKIDKDKERER